MLVALYSEQTSTSMFWFCLNIQLWVVCSLCKTASCLVSSHSVCSVHRCALCTDMCVLAFVLWHRSIHCTLWVCSCLEVCNVSWILFTLSVSLHLELGLLAFRILILFTQKFRASTGQASKTDWLICRGLTSLSLIAAHSLNW